MSIKLKFEKLYQSNSTWNINRKMAMNRIRFTNTGGSMWILVESRTQFLILKVIRLRNKRNIVPEQ